ncbi:hypothetical protein [Pedobacter frigidisoli]|uniref:hypothetical protein n=1 Tax=Pedobacter frigidisoli TaxID=2530455 RepID=UPI00292E90F3|nr:hypothetical protein [Pedobacter frigidisoli]
MKIVFPILAAASILAISCQSNNTSKTSSYSSLSKSDTHVTDCYIYAKSRDTATLTIATLDGKVSGNLMYKLSEKDINNGTIEGVVKGDTIIADYTFNSEGMESKRQVVWLKRDNKLIEGFGEQEEAGNTAKFKNNSSLKFAGSIEFSKVDCK